MEIKDGKVNADDVAFVETLNFAGNEITVTYAGKVVGDEIRLTRKVGEIATEEIVAKRVKGDKPAEK